MKKQILVVGRHPQIMETVLRLINAHPDWEAMGTLEDEKAIELFQQHSFHLVLIGGGVEAESELKMLSIFNFQRPLVPVIRHYGGGGGLLTNEIQYALQKAEEKSSGGPRFLDIF